MRLYLQRRALGGNSRFNICPSNGARGFMDFTQNELLTQVGPGTPMGEVLRRYWFPVAGVTEFDTQRVRAIRLLGEDLVRRENIVRKRDSGIINSRR